MTQTQTGEKMDLTEIFEMACGTTAGTKHRKGLLESNQDATVVFGRDGLLTLTTSDGISAAQNSFVASTLQTSWMTQILHAHTGSFVGDDVWRDFAREIAMRITLNASWSHLPLQEAVANTWSATQSAIVVTPELTYFAAFGDGRFVVNGELHRAETANEEFNQPAVPGYLVAESTLPGETLRFQVFSRPTEEIETAVVATDGLDDFMAAEGKIVPGTSERVPDTSYFWQHDSFFDREDADNIDTFLNYLARDYRKRGNVLSGGKLYDDLAVAVLRRKAG